jgi:hypothetical protein
LTDGHTDLYVTVYPRPFGQGSTTLASALRLAQYEWSFWRPVQGAININMARVPNSTQSFTTSTNRQFFEVLFHELNHVLAVSSSTFQYWINPATNSSYGSASVPIYTIPSGGDHQNKEFQILATPKLHRLLSARWGREYFYNNTAYPVGLEIEDTGRAGTVGSHWEGRTYYTEVMTGTTFGYASISPVTMTALEDTGWYECNMSLAEPLLWGDYRSIVGATIADFANFAIGPPATSWPLHYVPRTVAEKDKISCTYDHLAVARNTTMRRRSCGERTDGECQFPEFYDATGIGFYGSSGLDYALIPYRSFICKDVVNIGKYDSFYGVHFGPGTMCARSTLCLNGYTCAFPHTNSDCFLMDCPALDVITIWVGEELKAVNCTVAGEQMQVDGFNGSIECPDPKIVCGVINMRKGLPRTQSPSPCPSETALQPPTSSQAARTASQDETVRPPDKPRSGRGVSVMALGIGAAVVVGLLLIVGILICLVKKRLLCRRDTLEPSKVLLAGGEDAIDAF